MPLVWSAWRCEMTTKSIFCRSTPSAFTLCSKILALLPVSNRMRLPPYSTRAAKPQSRVRAGALPNESYRMVTRLGVSAELIPANSRTTVTARSEMRRYMFPPQNLARKQNGLPSKSPSGGAVSKSGNAGSLAGISILSSLAVGIVYPAASFRVNLARSAFRFEPPRDNSRVVGNWETESTFQWLPPVIRLEIEHSLFRDRERVVAQISCWRPTYMQAMCFPPKRKPGW